MPTNIKTIASILVLCLFFIAPVKAQDTGGNEIHYINDADINFNQLIGKFKNKIIYVDVWATWCGPCLQEFQKKKDVQAFAAFAAKNDIVILYICCDEDGSKWKSFIADNKLYGYHFLVNQQVYDDLHTAFALPEKKRGAIEHNFYIPRHLIIDKNGDVADNMADREGSRKVYAKLRQMLGSGGG